MKTSEFQWIHRGYAEVWDGLLLRWKMMQGKVRYSRCARMVFFSKKSSESSIPGGSEGET